MPNPIPGAIDPADVPFDDDPPNYTPPTPIPPQVAQPTRRRASLNMTVQDWANIEQLAAWERRTVTDTIRQSIETRRRVFIATRPELRWPDLDPADRPHPKHLAMIDDVTGDVLHLEILA